jgi:hypothetical protein
MDRDFEIEQIKKAVDAIMNHFPKYVKDCDLSWPVCYRCGSEMCQVIQKGKNMYFQCFEYGCGHKETSILLNRVGLANGNTIG